VTTCLLVRHALCDPVGRSIAGRAPGVHLNAEGREQAERLADRLSGLRLSAIYSSPLERAIETAAAIGRRHNLSVMAAPGLIEIDFGEWTGRTLAELDPLPQWKAFNSYRSGTRVPGGESMAEVVARALAEIGRIVAAHQAPAELVAMVSHGDVLRALIGHFLGAPIDLLQRIEISPGSVSVVEIEGPAPQVLLLNSMAGWPPALPPGTRR
jgi:probable phosphomutase (TIGR03848 family)